MYSFSQMRRTAAAVALAAGVYGLSTAAADAATVALAFDYTSGTAQTIGLVGGTGGTMTFSLTAGDGVNSFATGNFSMDVQGQSGTPLGRVEISGDTFFYLLGGGVSPQSLGDITWPGTGGSLAPENTWSLTVTGSDFPLSLIVTSQLLFTDFLGDPLPGVAPLLTVTFDTGLDVSPVAQTPVPAALPLFASGVALFGFFRLRRARRAAGARA